MWNIWDTTPR
jgi:hypothetical protein